VNAENLTARTINPPFRGQLMKYAKNPTGIYSVI
jgi:hypothetical protein